MMPLRIYSTESRRIEEFQPITPGHVKMYICGPTVYDMMHIGHARSYVFFDIIRRWLEHSGYDVIHVQNFSDVEESITRKARKMGMSDMEVADTYINEFFVDADSLNIKRAHRYPRYSENVPSMIRIVQDLLDAGLAYESRGDVYFRTKDGGGFGRLSHVDPREAVVDDLKRSGGRENPFDFLLWRKKRKEEEPSWPSPWGEGRPGWHVGCYAMSSGYLGSCFDIHGGGLDLIYPHHESILLVSEAHANQPICNYFIHNSFVTLGKKKMSKSGGNFVSVRELTQKYGGEALRFYLLKHPYRSILDYDEAELKKACKEFTELRGRLEAIARSRCGEASEKPSGEIELFISDFREAMNSDFHTGEALKVLSSMVDWAYQKSDNMSERKMGEALKVIFEFSNVLGLFSSLQIL